MPPEGKYKKTLIVQDFNANSPPLVISTRYLTIARHFDSQNRNRQSVEQ